MKPKLQGRGRKDTSTTGDDYFNDDDMGEEPATPRKKTKDICSINPSENREHLQN